MNIKGIKNLKTYEGIKKIRKNIKVATLAALSGLMITSFTGCSGCNVKEEEIVSEVTTENVSEIPVVDETPVQEADEEIYTLEDTAAIAANEALRVGMDLSYDGVVDENDVETYAKQFTNYLIVVRRDNFDDKLFAEMMVGSNVSADDLITSFMTLNTAFKKHLITVTNSNLYDFNNLYNEDDAEILNHAQKLIATINEKDLKSDERKEAAKEFYSYTTEILNSTNARMALSPEALDTLVTFVEAYDELTKDYEMKKIKGAYVDDELEHFLNISKESCYGEVSDSKLAVEDKVVENLKSLFRTHILTELNDRYVAAKEERALQLQLGNELNELNSYANIIEYVKGLIKIETYQAVKYDQETWLLYINGIQNLDGTAVVIQGGQSGRTVITPSGKAIDPASLNKYGIQTEGKTDAQITAEYEKKVQEAEEKKAEENKKVTTADGTVVAGTVEDAQNGYSAGYADGQKKLYNCPTSASDAYKKGYANGYSAGLANVLQQEQQHTTVQETYEPVKETVVETKEEVKTVEQKPAEQKPAEQKPAEQKPAEQKPAEQKPAEQKPAEQVPAEQVPVVPELPELEEFVPLDEEIIIDQTEEIKTLGALDELRYYRAILTNLPAKELPQTPSFRI